MHGWVREIGWGCWQMCRQFGMTLLYIHEDFSCLIEEADDHDIIRWHHWCPAYVNEGRYEKVCMNPRGSFTSGSWSFGSFPNWFVWEAIDPLTQLPWCQTRSGIITLQGSVLYLFTHTCSRLSWAPWVSAFRCLWASQVACHPVSIKPSIRVARTTALCSEVAHMG